MLLVYSFWKFKKMITIRPVDSKKKIHNRIEKHLKMEHFKGFNTSYTFNIFSTLEHNSKLFYIARNVQEIIYFFLKR